METVSGLTMSDREVTNPDSGCQMRFELEEKLAQKKLAAQEAAQKKAPSAVIVAA